MVEVFYKDTSFKFNRIYVVESLIPQESDESVAYQGLTGLQLAKEVLEKLQQEYGGFKCVYKSISSKEDWKYFFETLYGECKENNCFPLLHFEIHAQKYTEDELNHLKKGDPALLLKNDETINFLEFENDITKINEACGCNLFVNLGVCRGLIHSLNAISITKVMPFFAALGSLDNLNENHLVRNFRAFYSHLFLTKNLEDAYKEIETTEPNDDNYYELQDSYKFFFNAWIGYIKNECSPEARKKWIFKHGFLSNDIRFNFWFESFIAYLQEKYMKQDYERFANIYFHLDKYPENEERFHVPKNLVEFLERENMHIE